MSFATQINQIQANPRFDTVQFDEFYQLARAFSDQDLLDLFLPGICLPSLAEHVEKNSEWCDVASNSWFMTYKPSFLIDLRLKIFTASIEGQLKLLFEVLSDWLVNQYGVARRANHTLGGIFNHVETNKALLPPQTLTYFNSFTNVVKVRNAISHQSYLINIVTNKISLTKLIQITQSNLSGNGKALLASIAKSGISGVAQMIHMPEVLGKMIGFKPEITVFDEVDNLQSEVIFQDYKPGNWQPITQSSQRISLTDLKDSLNSFDIFSFSSFFGLMKDFDERFQRNVYDERVCGSCSTHNYNIAGATGKFCWYCAGAI